MAQEPLGTVLGLTHAVPWDVGIRTGWVAACESYCSCPAPLKGVGIFADHQLEAMPGADAVGWPWPSQQIPGLIVWRY